LIVRSLFTTVNYIINAPLEKINIADWLFNLTDAEYQHCSYSYIAAGMSISDSIGKNGRTKIQVVWKLSAKKIDDHTCQYSNHIHGSATNEFLAFIKENGIPFEQAKAIRQAASDSHNHGETPNFAKSIERRALQG
jgi:hypothetical protein